MSNAEALQIVAALITVLASVTTGLEQRLVRKLKKSGATSPETAIELLNLYPLTQWKLSRLESVGAVVRVESERIYLNEPTLQELHKRRRLWAPIIVLSVIVLFAVSLFLTNS